ncbi:MAG TPA: hypothetical protein VFW29_01965, partial [Solirubrobacteraceae bacterium]|nr:hypothetical protein [Solirubrobacteraceae bacterium]
MTEPRPQTESELIERLRAIEVQAPPELHQRVNAMISEHAAGDRRAPRPTLGLRWAGASALATAVAIVAIVLAVGGGSTSAPALTQAAKLTLRPATLPAPSESSSRHATLTAQVEGVAFPYWKDRFGWN